MKKLTNKNLKNMFNVINETFFNGELNPTTKVQFANNKDCDNCDGLHFSTGEILIHEDFKKHPDSGIIILIHEMTHAILFKHGYIGWPKDEHHNLIFQAEIDRLYKAGAFEGLLAIFI